MIIQSPNVYLKNQGPSESWNGVTWESTSTILNKQNVDALYLKTLFRSWLEHIRNNKSCNEQPGQKIPKYYKLLVKSDSLVILSIPCDYWCKHLLHILIAWLPFPDLEKLEYSFSRCGIHSSLLTTWNIKKLHLIQTRFLKYAEPKVMLKGIPFMIFPVLEYSTYSS